MAASASIPATGAAKRPFSSLQDDCAGWESGPPMDMPMRTSFDLPIRHYAMIYMDNMGKLKVSGSASVHDQHDTLFTADMRERFLEIHRSLIPRPSSSSAYPHGYAHPEDFSYQVKKYRTSIQNPACDIHLSSQNSDSAEQFPQYPSTSMVKTKIGDAKKVLEYYKNSLEYFQQSNCRQIAKAFIKFIEPQKRAKYPYNGRSRARRVSSEMLDPEKTKPGWWPAGVVHREPDHLCKEQRIRLLIHIVCKLEITPDKLQEVAYECRSQLNPATKIQVLDEIFKVRRMEERYERGEVDATTMVNVVNWDANQKGEKDSKCISEPEQKVNVEEVGEVGEGFLTPALSARQTQTSFASVDMTKGASGPMHLGDDRDQLFPLPKSFDFKEQPRTGRTYYPATPDYSDGYGRGLLKSPVNLRMVRPSDQTGPFEYLALVPFTASTIDDSKAHEWPASCSDTNAAIPMQHSISHHDSSTRTCRQNVFNPMEYGTAADQIFSQPTVSSTMLIPPASLAPYMPHGLPDPTDHKPAVIRPEPLMASYHTPTV